MSDFIKRLDPSWVRGLISLLLIIAIIAGFFMGIVPVEFIKDLTLMALSFFFGCKVPTYSEEQMLKKTYQKPK